MNHGKLLKLTMADTVVTKVWFQLPGHNGTDYNRIQNVLDVNDTKLQQQKNGNTV